MLILSRRLGAIATATELLDRLTPEPRRLLLVTLELGALRLNASVRTVAGNTVTAAFPTEGHVPARRVISMEDPTVATVLATSQCVAPYVRSN
jgi:hypothetical protein